VRDWFGPRNRVAGGDAWRCSELDELRVAGIDHGIASRSSFGPLEPSGLWPFEQTTLSSTFFEWAGRLAAHQQPQRRARRLFERQFAQVVSGQRPAPSASSDGVRGPP
jgi:hypothetical protein